MGSDEYYNSQEKPVLNVDASSPKEPYKITDDISIPASINQYLRSYQRDGASFLYEHLKNKTGCILADDMGLGKTIQVISFFAAVMKKTGTAADALHKNRCTNHIFLVVAPTSVLYNWMDELETWGYFRVGKFHRQNKEEVMDEVRAGKLEILMTTHETMRINIDMLNVVNWTAVVLDEAHKIKQPSSQITIAAKQLNSNCKIGLTGTPLQNNLKELWCLLDWVNPGCLGVSEEFNEKFAQPICMGQRYNSNKRELATARKKQQELNMLHKRWMLRRTKDMIQDQLPRKDEKIVFCSLSSLQVSMYETILKLPKVKRLVELDVVCKCGSERLSRKCCLKNFNWRKWLFPYIQILLKTSNHAALLLPHHNQSSEQKEMCKEICELLFPKYPMLQEMYKKKKFSQMSDPSYCGKMAVLQKLLAVLYEKKDKVLLFSHSTQLLNILEAYVMGRGMIYRRLDGDTSAEKRNSIVKEFNNDTSIFICLLSTTAGSLGLNLTAANFVIIFDPLWNPTYDQQAQDRAYRIGQQRNVFVYRFISVGTIEENIYMRQIYKQQLANIAINTSNERRYFAGVAGDKKHRGELFGIANMFKFSPDHNSVFAKQTFEKVKSVENGVPVANYEGEVAKSKKEEDVPVEEPDDPFAVAATQCIEEESTDDDDDDDQKVCKKYTDLSDELKRTANMKNENNSYNNVLVDCGVKYAHSTKSVVGSSITEQKLSNKAMKDVFWDGLNSQLPANDVESIQEEEESEEITSKNEGNTTDQASLNSCKVFERVGTDMFIVGCTPPAIQAKHFKDIAIQSGYESETEFAKYLRTCSNLQMNKILRKFYSEKEPNICQLSSFNQIYDCKETVENICGNGKSLKKKTLKYKTRCKFQGNKVIRPRTTYKKLNWDDVFQNELSDDDIKEYESDGEKGINYTKDAMSTPKLKSGNLVKGKMKSSKIKSPVVSPVSLNTIPNKVCRAATGINSVPKRTLNTLDDGSNLEDSTPPIENNPDKPDINPKSVQTSVIDELIFSPKNSNDKNPDSKSKNKYKTESIFSDNDITLEDILTSNNEHSKTYEHSLDELLDKSPESPLLHFKMNSKKQSNTQRTSPFHSETNSCQVTEISGDIVTMNTAEVSKFIKGISNGNDSSILDELLDSKPSYSYLGSPRKKARNENYDGKIKYEPSSIIDEFI